MQKKGPPYHVVAHQQSRYDSTLKGLLILGGLLVLGGSYEISEIDISLLWSEEGVNGANSLVLSLSLHWIRFTSPSLEPSSAYSLPFRSAS